MAVTAAKSVMAFRVLDHGGRPVQTDNERTSKARIIHQIQLIRGITVIRFN
ncbi:Transposase [Shigella dysenteriae 1617]|uniref:Transposase n=1 Tax=Shigella dysenteriae 1617 TaxID=754093 RepID=A0A0A6ZRR6_SHIDY|nr:Transposase [Shigella dysenteriae 1617]